MADQNRADQQTNSGITLERYITEHRDPAFGDALGEAMMGDTTTDLAQWQYELRLSRASSFPGDLARTSTNQHGLLTSPRASALPVYNHSEDFKKRRGYPTDGAPGSLMLDETFELPLDPNFKLVQDGQHLHGLAGDRAIPRYLSGMPEFFEAVGLSRTSLAPSLENQKSAEEQQIAQMHLPTECNKTAMQQGRSCEDSQMQKLRAWFLDISVTLGKVELTIPVRGKLPAATRRPKRPKISQTAALSSNSDDGCCISALHEAQTKGLETDFS